MKRKRHQETQNSTKMTTKLKGTKETLKEHTQTQQGLKTD